MDLRIQQVRAKQLLRGDMSDSDLEEYVQERVWLTTLEKAVAEGWRPVDAEYPSLAHEPEYAVIRDDPSLRRLDAILAADAARERRELLAAGL